MKATMRMFSWLLVLALAMVTFGVNAQTSTTPTQTVCIGNEPYLVEATNPPGTTYNWRIDGATTGANWQINGNGNNAITIDWNVAGTYVLSIFTTLDGCNGDTSEVTVTVQPRLSITIVPDNPAPICEGMTVTFDALAVNAGPGATYQWYVNNVAEPGATNTTFTYTGVAPGATIYCEVTSADACAINGTHTARSNEVNVMVNAQISLLVSITADQDTICLNGQINFAATVEPQGTAVTYQWFEGGLPIAGATAATYLYTGSTAGAYSITCQVTLVGPQGCFISTTATSDPINILVKPKPATSLIYHN